MIGCDTTSGNPYGIDIGGGTSGMNLHDVDIGVNTSIGIDNNIEAEDNDEEWL